ncbi:MAG: nuclear transport factor 2 family protein [Rhizobacter sp.]|nr:nuclear transport factor 2 family protein [Ferruginibacter sp.]
MKKILLLVAIGFCVLNNTKAQSDSSFLVAFNQQVDDNVVKKNIEALEKAYANDFVFSHGSGKVEGKSTWLISAAKGFFRSRTHDSVKVEMHQEVAIVKGKLSVAKTTSKERTDRYHLYYIRVYAKRDNNWQMISHSTTAEYHEK